MASTGKFVVYDAARLRLPSRAVRVVSEEGHAFHVIEENDLRQKNDATAVPFAEAVTEAFRRAGRPLPVVDSNA